MGDEKGFEFFGGLGGLCVDFGVVGVGLGCWCFVNFYVFIVFVLCIVSGVGGVFGLSVGLF